MRPSCLVAFLPLLLSLGACGGNTASSGVPPLDASAPRIDGGDGGRDAGMSVPDAGGGPVDASTPVDASATPDAGTPPDDAGASGCGTCPAGTTCGSANGMPVCRTADGIPRFTHVFVIVMENMSLSTVTGATNTPYVSSLFSDWATASNYHGVAHPSLPNYLAMTSGMDVTGVGCDCHPTGDACGGLTCNTVLGNCGCPQSVMNLGDQLEAASLTWKDYGEDMGTACNTTDSGQYAARHVPFLYYHDVQTNMARCTAHVVDYSHFTTDLGSAPPTYAIIAPNLVHDMHGSLTTSTVTNLANGDAWLSTNVPPILASSAFTSGGLLVVVWDEDDLSGVIAPDDPIGLIVMSPYAKQSGYVSAVHADHSSLLATIEDGLGLSRLGSAVSATPLTDFFPSH